VTESLDLRQAAREIYSVALQSVDAGDAVRRAARFVDSRLTIRGTTFDLTARTVYVLAIGKAARRMAIALNEILPDKITAGLIVSSSTAETTRAPVSLTDAFNSSWRTYVGGHPLPNEASLMAARAAFALLQRANDEQALVIFLISGGGSAMMEWPNDEGITLAELRAANRALVSCGASILEINAVRRAFSAVKGGRLAARAPRAEQVSLIISDTGRGQETIVASGPTCDPAADAPDAKSVITRYDLAKHLPEVIMRVVNDFQEDYQRADSPRLREHHLLLDNDTVLQAAADEAQRRGFAVEIAFDISEQRIAEGCAQMLARLEALRKRAAGENKIACLISGGEFACPMRGEGIGGRNAETVLRCALEIDERSRQEASGLSFARLAILSAGTDGIDGNSPAAGAVADETTVTRARELNLDARGFLDKSDAYSFFNALGDTIVTGTTGTNVRDLRILLAS
jgi:glycerate 2-kinase